MTKSKTTNVGGAVEKTDILYVVGAVNWSSHSGKEFEIMPRKLANSIHFVT